MMLRGFSILVLCAVPATMASQGANREPTPAISTSSLAGQIVSDEATPRPIGRAVVTVKGSSIEDRSAITTDDGHFQFLAVPEGRFTVTAAKPAYLETSYGARKAGGPGTSIALARDERVNITIRLAFGGVLAGTVRNRANEPVPGVSIDARLVQSGGETLKFAGRGQTDDRGMYRIFGLPAGDYVVVATTAPLSIITNITQPTVTEVDAILGGLTQRARAASAGVALPGTHPALGNQPAVRFVSVYFPGVWSAQEATRVTLHVAEERAGLDFSYDPVTTADIEGRISGPVQNLTTAQIGLHPVGPGVTTTTDPTVRPTADGTFTFTGVAPGRYTITTRASRDQTAPAPTAGPQVITLFTPSADAAKTADADFFYATTEVEVRGDIVKNVSLALQPGSVLSGRIRFQSTQSPTPDRFTGIRVSVSPVGAPARPFVMSGGFTMLREASVQGDGTFTVKSIGPGPNSVRVTLPSELSRGGWWPRSAMLEGRDLLDSDPEFTPGTDWSGVVLTLSDQHTELSGVLHTAVGQPAPEYVVVVYSTDRRAWRADSRRTQMVRPASDGNFQMRDLPAGEYFIAAVTQIDPDELLTSGFFARLVPASLKFSIAEGEKKVQDLRLAGGQ
jgi:hypothetical protein